MAALQGVTFNILSKHLDATVQFYTQLLDFEIGAQTDWFVELSPPGQPDVRLAIVSEQSEFTPRQAFGMPAATFLTFEVDNLEAVLERARALDADVIQEPVVMDYGPTRALIRDRNGFVIEFLAATGAAESVGREDPLRSSLQQPVGRGFDPAGKI